ncbi:MAG: MBL fold metallo-hydrolase [Puniceicoccales bacterium]|jgi:glyoxylase-like metal-dependent hydrolase (beta-lactamase superfamily II)|nr:MBL fold metallo-hydrolase [Puniceicoccales bacterium]
MDRKKFLVASSDGVNVYVAKCGHIKTNTGFIENYVRGEAVLIDAPFGSFDASKKILSHGTKVVALLFTHCHWDHIGDGHIFRGLGARTYAHALDRPLIENPELMAMLTGIGDELIPCRIDVEIADGDCVNVGNWLSIDSRWVPGHAAGDLAFYIESSSCVFAGDTLFRGGIGRSDLLGGNELLLIRGIKEKILSLPDGTIVIPGHGNFSTIAREKLHNEFLQ